MNKIMKITVTGITVLTLGGMTTTTASASLVPKAMRGTWYAYNGSGSWSKIKYKKHSKMYISAKANNGWYTVMPKNTSTETYSRVLTQKIAGKKRKVLLGATYWDMTTSHGEALKWFHSRLHHRYFANLSNYAKPF